MVKSQELFVHWKECLSKEGLVTTGETHFLGEAYHWGLEWWADWDRGIWATLKNSLIAEVSDDNRGTDRRHSVNPCGSQVLHQMKLL